ncbi:MAG TPA: hypothetical protein VM715_02320, partial [Candidatus Acidoferrum sp.]|nr:hypothetical protein [Candidatus Acidoferrum sp.]
VEHNYIRPQLGVLTQYGGSVHHSPNNLVTFVLFQHPANVIQDVRVVVGEEYAYFSHKSAFNN